MTKREKVRFDMFIRVFQFITDNIGEFAAGSVVAVQLAVLQDVIGRIQNLLGEQTTGLDEARYTYNSKATVRENLRDLLADLARTARSMVYQFPGIHLKFPSPRNDSDAQLLGKGHSFQTEAAPYEADFVANEMETDFLTELQDLTGDFERSFNKTGAATDSHVEATADIGEEIRQGMIAVRSMKGAVLNKFRNDPGKLAAWMSASHIEKIPHGEKDDDAPTQ